MGKARWALPPQAPAQNPGGCPRAVSRLYSDTVDFRTSLLQTLRAIQPVLLEEGVLVAGSEVPNLLEPEARSTLVVSRDVDIAVPI